jgi:GNAT superfamily N-acetyltransferase
VAKPTHHTWRLTAADADEAGNLLARAFQDEPIVVAALPDPADRVRLLPGLCATNIRCSCEFGEAWAIGDDPGDMAGVAYWLAMPEADLAAEQAARLGYDVLAAQWGDAWERLSAMEGNAIAAIGRLPRRWRYLEMIGVAPDRQGKGLGSALLAKVLEDAALAGLPLVLVTDRAANLPFYERAGLKLVAQGAALNGTVPWWTFRTR